MLNALASQCAFQFLKGSPKTFTAIFVPLPNLGNE
jgi:hypothetical protein